jgi:hypothetical protein
MNMKKWKSIRCFCCYGTGMVSDYGCGEDFYGPKECDMCAGNGKYWKHKSGVIAQYPGGPFLGKEAPERGASVEAKPDAS